MTLKKNNPPALRRGRAATTGLLKDFREFTLKGNVVELAIAVIIGTAFGKIVSSFVADVIMPLLNPLIAFAGKDWRTFEIGPGIKIGSFLGSVVDFVIIAFVLFLAIRALERFKRQAERQEAPQAPQAPQLDPVQVQERLAATLERLTQLLESQKK